MHFTWGHGHGCVIMVLRSDLELCVHDSGTDLVLQYRKRPSHHVHTAAEKNFSRITQIVFCRVFSVVSLPRRPMDGGSSCWNFRHYACVAKSGTCWKTRVAGTYSSPATTSTTSRRTTELTGCSETQRETPLPTSSSCCSAALESRGQALSYHRLLVGAKLLRGGQKTWPTKLRPTLRQETTAATRSAAMLPGKSRRGSTVERPARTIPRGCGGGVCRRRGKERVEAATVVYGAVTREFSGRGAMRCRRKSLGRRWTGLARTRQTEEWVGVVWSPKGERWQ